MAAASYLRLRTRFRHPGGFLLDAPLRTVKDRVLEPVARALGRAVHPNAVSLTAFAVGLGAAWMAYRGSFGAALALWLLNRTLDGLDGVLARVQLRQSDFGAYLDILCDFAIYALIPVALAVGSATAGALGAALYLMASFYVNAASWMYLSAVLERRGRGVAATGERTGVTMPEGLIGGTETIVLYSLFFLVPRFVVPVFTLMTVLVLATVAQRVAWAARRL
jgi:phosphatidylglycerophosphate synthase